MSPRSSKKAKKSKGSSSRPPLDAYTGLLFAGFLAVAIGCALLAVELTRYDWAVAN